MSDYTSNFLVETHSPHFWPYQHYSRIEKVSFRKSLSPGKLPSLTHSPELGPARRRTRCSERWSTCSAGGFRSGPGTADTSAGSGWPPSSLLGRSREKGKVWLVWIMNFAVKHHAAPPNDIPSVCSPSISERICGKEVSNFRGMMVVSPNCFLCKRP